MIEKALGPQKVLVDPDGNEHFYIGNPNNPPKGWKVITKQVRWEP